MEIKQFKVFSEYLFYRSIFLLILVFGITTYMWLSLGDKRYFFPFILVYLGFYLIFYKQEFLPSSIMKIEITEDDTIVFSRYIGKSIIIKISSLNKIIIGDFKNNYVFIDENGRKIGIRPQIECFDILIKELKIINKDLLII